MGLVAGAFVLFTSWAVVAWVACAFFTVNVAASKNLSKFSWFIGALCFGPIALIAAAGMASKSPQ